MPKFTQDEQDLLAPYVSNIDGTIYAVKGPTGMVGAVFARYSRAQGGFRQTLLKEFIKEGVLDPKRAEELLQRVLIAFGDDSVGELEGTHMAFEDISILATKEIEDRRIGGSPIEQSTRYVFYDMPGDDGLPRYFRPEDVMASAHADAYVETMEFIFATYRSLIEPMKAYYTNLKPIADAEYDINGDGVKERYADLTDEGDRRAFRQTYSADMRTKACDTLRALLPIATKTNVGIFGNGRFYQHTLSHCYSSDLPEVQSIAKSAHAELAKVIPNFVKRAGRSAYQVAVRNQVRELASGMFTGWNSAPATGILLDRGEDAIARLLNNGPVTAESVSKAFQGEADALTEALMLYPHLTMPLAQIRDGVRNMPPAARERIHATYLGDRKTRRDRPGRALEGGYPYTFDLVSDFGTYKDLERHRMLTQDRQAFTPTMGFTMPEDLVKMGFRDQVQACVDRAVALYKRLLPEFPVAAAYATLHGSHVRWTMGINDRALMHMLELRTGPQGHPNYRKLCQEMHVAASARSDWRGQAMKFVDYNDYFWARGDSEAHQRAKEAKLDKSTA